MSTATASNAVKEPAFLISGDILPLLAAALAVCVMTLLVTKGMHVSRFVLLPLFLIAGAGLFFLGVASPKLILYLLVAYLPFSKQLTVNFGSLSQGINVTNLLAAMIFFYWWKGKEESPRPLWIAKTLEWAMLTFLAAGLLSIGLNFLYGPGYLVSAIVEFKDRTMQFLLYFLFVHVLTQKETLRNVVTLMMFAVFMTLLNALYQYLDEGRRVGGIAENPNILSGFFNSIIFLYLGFFLQNFHNKKYWLFLALFLIGFRGIMVTFSRGGYLAFAFGLHAIIFFRSKRLFLLLILISSFVVMNPQFLPKGIRYRLGKTISQTTPANSESSGLIPVPLEKSTLDRVEVWRGALRMIAEYPLAGVGYSLFKAKVQHYWSGQRSFSPHNTYLLIAAEMGVPVLLVFLTVLFVIGWNARQLYRASTDPFSKSVALGLLGGLSANMMSYMHAARLDPQEISGYFALLTAVVMRLRWMELIQNSRTGGLSHE